MKILITDDERLIRLSLLSMLEELYPGVHYISQAKDGEEMIRMVEKEFYDIVFLDINMPKINGLDALEVCRKKAPETQWCVLTGYAEFEYAKRSIGLGVKEYLLKPLDIDQLKQLMEGLMKEKQEKLQNQNQLFENRVSRAFALADMAGGIKQMQPAGKDSVYSIYIFFLDTDENKKRQEMYAKLYENLSGYLKKNIECGDRYALFFLQTSELCLIIEGREYMKLHSYLRHHRDVFDRDARIAAVWAAAKDFKELYMDKQVMLALSNVRILEENYKTITLQELNEQSDLMEKQYLCEKIEMLTASYMTGNYAMANELLQEMEREHGLKDSFEKIDSRPLRSYLSVIWKSSFEGEEYADLLRQFQNLLQNAMWEHNSENQDIIQQIKEYVAVNYMNDVTIAVMGNRFDISPSYISRIFRNKTGEKYIDFVTGVRMKKAMELIRMSPALSVKEVAERVGYISEKHFSKTFKKNFDCLPSHVAKE
ncbi:MAG: response regulator [Muricomes sp.]|uniref:response regulator n=3 Tax=Faecalicatena contorta TaxID=39482 RepID=UPI002ECBEFBE|nr:response regulator [Muricomes sp.]